MTPPSSAGFQKNDEFSYREEINHLAEWCTENNLLLNVSKTKELIVDFRKKEAKTHNPVYISGAEEVSAAIPPDYRAASSLRL